MEIDPCCMQHLVGRQMLSAVARAWTCVIHLSCKPSSMIASPLLLRQQRFYTAQPRCHKSARVVASTNKHSNSTNSMHISAAHALCQQAKLAPPTPVFHHRPVSHPPATGVMFTHWTNSTNHIISRRESTWLAQNVSCCALHHGGPHRHARSIRIA